MSHSHLTKWIEDAEARQVFETAMVDRDWAVTESHFLHLGEAITKVPFWSRDGVSRELLTIGGHVLDRMRHPLSRKQN